MRQTEIYNKVQRHNIYPFFEKESAKYFLSGIYLQGGWKILLNLQNIDINTFMFKIFVLTWLLFFFYMQLFLRRVLTLNLYFKNISKLMRMFKCSKCWHFIVYLFLKIWILLCLSRYVYIETKCTQCSSGIKATQVQVFVKMVFLGGFLMKKKKKIEEFDNLVSQTCILALQTVNSKTTQC